MIDLGSDLQVTFGTAWGEARGEPLLGQQGVVSTIVNRAEYARLNDRPQFGSGTLRSACLAPWQYSCWNEGNPNRAKILALDPNALDPLTVQIMEVAQQAATDTLIDPTGGAFFYKVTTLPWPDEWGPEVAPLVVIGRQSFYSLVATHPMLTA